MASIVVGAANSAASRRRRRLRRLRRPLPGEAFASVATFLLPLILLLSNLPASAKKVSGRVKLSGANTESTVTKFALSPRALGSLHVTITTPDMYVDESNLRLHLYTDDVYRTKVKNAPTCADKVRYATSKHHIVFNMKQAGRGRKGKEGRDLWTANVKTDLNNRRSDRPVYWYATIDDCNLEMYDHDAGVPTLEYEAIVMDDVGDGARTTEDAEKAGGGINAEMYGDQALRILSHLSADERGMKTLHAINFVVSALLTALLSLNVLRKVAATRGDVHISVFVVANACAYDAIASLSELIHLKAYERDGVGSYFADACSSHFEATCDSLVALVLLSVGSGWTLPSDVVSIPLDSDGGGAGGGGGAVARAVRAATSGFRSPARACASLTPTSAFALVVILAHAALAQWGRTYDDDFDSYHALEHPPGRALMGLRIALGFAFLVGVASVRAGGRCPRTLKPFLAKFAAVGMGWFVSLPFWSSAVATFLPYHRRHQALSIGAAIVQLSSLVALSWLFTAGRGASAYHRVSKAVGKGEDLTDLVSSGIGGGEAAAAGGRPDGGKGGKVTLRSWKLGKTKVRLD